MDLQKLQTILSVVGAVALGLPVFLRAALAFCKLIPGEQPDVVIEKLLSVSEKVEGVISKLYPKKAEPAPEQK